MAQARGVDGNKLSSFVRSLRQEQQFGPSHPLWDAEVTGWVRTAVPKGQGEVLLTGTTPGKTFCVSVSEETGKLQIGAVPQRDGRPDFFDITWRPAKASDVGALITALSEKIDRLEASSSDAQGARAVLARLKAFLTRQEPAPAPKGALQNALEDTLDTIASAG